MVAVDEDAVAPAGDAVLLVVDDCTIHRESLCAAVEAAGLPAPARAWDLLSLVTVLDEVRPTVALVNIATRDCVALLRSATDIVPGLRAIVVGVAEDQEATIVACAEVGVAHFHMRPDTFDELLRVIAQVSVGETACTPAVSAMLLRRLSSLAGGLRPAPREPALTTREAQILRMLELGRSNQDIADQLSITIHTVKNHVHSLLTKLGVGTRAEAAALSHRWRRSRE